MSDSYSKNLQSEYRYVDRFSDDYPEKLNFIKDPPAGLYVKGSLPNSDRPSVAIVGSRICSQYGRLAAEEFGKALALHNVQIISGLARGIDSLSQKAACLAGGKSYGILGCGINVVYPAQNKGIYELVEANGGLISEFPPDAPPLKPYFASRNRIISALADIVLVIEAKEKSGTQITVSRALEQGKDIYALPGRIHDLCSEGCNNLIAQGAGIATSPDVILNALGIYPGSPSEYSIGSADPCLERLEQIVFSVLDFYPKTVSQIAADAKIPIPELMNILFHLQLKGYAAEEGRSNFVKTMHSK